MKQIVKHSRWIFPTFLFVSLMFTPGAFWKFYWFNYRIMERVNEFITAI